jgi:hypothetical protein
MLPPPLPRRRPAQEAIPPAPESVPDPRPDDMPSADEDLFADSEAPAPLPRAAHVWLRGGRLRIPAPAAADQAAARQRLARWSRRRGRRL